MLIVVFDQFPNIIQNPLFDLGKIGKIIQRIQPSQLTELNRVFVVYPDNIGSIADDSGA